MSDYFDRVERQIVQRVQDGVPRSSRRPSISGYLATAAAAAVVIVVAGVFLLAHGSSTPVPTSTAGKAVTVTFDASVIAPQTRPSAALDRSVVVLRERLRTFFPAIRVMRVGNEIVVDAPNAGAGARARILALAVPGQLAMYDWEADVFTPSGKTVASQLQTQDPTAVEISQGSGSSAPGDASAGGLSLNQVSALFAKLSGRKRLLREPGQLGLAIPSEGFQPGLRSHYVVLEAASPSGFAPANLRDPGARFYVLKNDPRVTGAGITRPRTSTDPNVAGPGVAFDFTANGAVSFKALTSAISDRGDRLSGVGQTLNQHFAIALDGRLLTVPYIDFKQYPNGIDAANGASIAGSFTTQTAKDLATILRYGPLPVTLTAAG